MHWCPKFWNRSWLWELFFVLKLMSEKFLICNGPPKERYLKCKGYLCFDIDHVHWGQDLCSLIAAIYENSFRESSATFIEDTFREIQDDIFNTFGEPRKTVSWTASSILGQANDKAYVLQEYNQHLTDQFCELVNFTGTKCLNKGKMFLLFLQQILDPLRRENWKNFCEKIGVKICSEKVGDLL